MAEKIKVWLTDERMKIVTIPDGQTEIYFPEEYNINDLSSMGGRAEGMFIAQSKYPMHSYDKRDRIESADHDRLLQQNFTATQEIIKRHTGGGELDIGNWAKKNKKSPGRVINCLKELLVADTNVVWTGYRILATVNRSNGYVVYTLELFAKHPESTTEVGDIPKYFRYKSLGR
jgi:hypothetical protein